MTSEPLIPAQDPSDPTSFPPLFSSPPARPGRVRGGFSMRTGSEVESAAPVPLDAVPFEPVPFEPAPFEPVVTRVDALTVLEVEVW